MTFGVTVVEHDPNDILPANIANARSRSSRYPRFFGLLFSLKFCPSSALTFRIITAALSRLFSIYQSNAVDVSFPKSLLNYSELVGMPLPSSASLGVDLVRILLAPRLDVLIVGLSQPSLLSRFVWSGVLGVFRRPRPRYTGLRPPCWVFGCLPGLSPEWWALESGL